MAGAKRRQPVDAKVVDVDEKVEPVDAVVVADNRNSLGKRLGIFALALLLLFFGINGYIQSAKNGHKTAVANHKIDELIDTIVDLSRTNAGQTKLIRQLQQSQRRQNHILEKHGFKTVVIPGDNSSPEPQPPNSDNLSNGHKPSKNHDEKKPHHGGNGDKPPPDDDGPLDKVSKTVCDLTGICLLFTGSNNANDHQQQGVRRSEVYCTSGTTSVWWLILCPLTNLGAFTWR